MLVLAIVAFSASAVAAPSADPPELPTFPEIKQAVASYFAALPDYRSGDLLTQSRVRPVFDKLKAMGWDVADRDVLLNLVPDDNELFVRKLRGSPAGVKFMRSIAGYPYAYDRVDRLGRMIRADENIQSLINGPDSWKMLQYMTQTVWGSGLGKQLSRAPRGAQFNAPTGRLYTGQDFIDRLEQSYADELERRAKAAGN